MSIFDIFKRKRNEQDDDELRWDKMWELWEKGEAASPGGCSSQKQTLHKGHIL